jgi:hypothetical protein
VNTLSSDGFVQLRFHELRPLAKSGALAPDERAEYEELKERLAAAICAAQNIHVRPGQSARSLFHVAALFKAEISIGGAVHRAATMDLSAGGFSVLLSFAATPGTEVSFTMRLSARSTIWGRAVVVGSESERSAGLYRASFAFGKLTPAHSGQLEEALFDAALLHKRTPPAPFVSPPREVSPEHRSTPSAIRPSFRCAPVAGPPAPPLRSLTPAAAARLSPEARRAVGQGDTPVVPPPREGVASVDDPLEEAMVEMEGAYATGRREETPPPKMRAAPASLHGPDETQVGQAAGDPATAAACTTPFALAGAKPGTSSPPSAPKARRLWPRVLMGGGAVLVSLIATNAARHVLAGRRSGEASGLTAPTSVQVASAGVDVPPIAVAPSLPSTHEAAASLTTATPPMPTAGSVRVTVKGPRVFIDGRFAGEGPRTFPLLCGAHEVQVGSAGVVRAIDVPCGGEIVIEKR